MLMNVPYNSRIAGAHKDPIIILTKIVTYIILKIMPAH